MTKPPIIESATGLPEHSPGTFGCHEALHLAHVFGEMVDNYLIDHPAVQANQEWLRLAETASKALIDLYQAIGQEHLLK